MFFSKLCGVEEVPAVETMARGKAYFVLSQDNRSLEFKLRLYGINQVTMGVSTFRSRGDQWSCCGVFIWTN